MIRFKCPACNKALHAKDENAGKLTCCTNCKAFAIVPAMSPSGAVAAGGTQLEVDVELIPTDENPDENLSGLAMVAGASPTSNGEADNEVGIQAASSQAPVPMTVQGPMMRFLCPHCNAPQEIAMNYAGQMVQCPLCELPFQLPMPQAKPIVKAAAAPAQKVDLDLEDTRPIICPQQKPQERNSATVVIAVFASIVALTLVSFLVLFLVYQDIRNENRREFERLSREVNEMDHMLGQLDVMKARCESKLDEAQRTGVGIEQARADLAETRRIIANGEKTRQLHYKKMDSLWPR